MEAGEKTLEQEIITLLTDRGWTISTAESCTGGLTAARLIDVPGASQVFLEGFITYANEAKTQRLGVSAETLKTYGAVSAPTAVEMASGGAAAAGSDLCISTTGLAGPGGGTDKKPVGLVYMACCCRGRVTAAEHYFTGSRSQIRSQAVQKALELVYGSLMAEIC